MRHDEDGHLRSAEHAIGDAADEEGMKAPVTVGAEHDDVGAEVVGLAEDRLGVRPAKGMRVSREALPHGLRRDRLDASVLFAQFRRDLIAHGPWPHLVADEGGLRFADVQHVELPAEGSRERHRRVHDPTCDVGEIHARENDLHVSLHRTSRRVIRLSPRAKGAHRRSCFSRRSQIHSPHVGSPERREDDVTNVNKQPFDHVASQRAMASSPTRLAGPALFAALLSFTDGCSHAPPDSMPSTELATSSIVARFSVDDRGAGRFLDAFLSEAGPPAPEGHLVLEARRGVELVGPDRLVVSDDSAGAPVELRRYSDEEGTRYRAPLDPRSEHYSVVFERAGGRSVSTVTMPERPVVVFPAPGESLEAGKNLPIRFTAPAEDELLASVVGSCVTGNDTVIGPNAHGAGRHLIFLEPTRTAAPCDATVVVWRDSHGVVDPAFHAGELGQRSSIVASQSVVIHVRVVP